MKESIFFNREQLKLIRWYWILFQVVFKFGIGILSVFLSVIAVWWIFYSWYFSSIYLLEKEDVGEVSPAMLHYNDKVRQVETMTWLEWKVLNWKISLSDGQIVAQDCLLVSNWLVLPRLTDISYDDLVLYSSGQNQESYDSTYMSRFFYTVLVKPLSRINFWENSPSLFQMNSSMKDLFGLGCTISPSKNSFVCKSYVNSFLNRFYLYDLKNSVDEINQYYLALQWNDSDKKRMCEWLIRYGKYWDTMDARLSDLFRSCWSEYYNEYILLRDFLELTKALWASYVEWQAYTDPDLNQYKLYALLQQLYRELSASTTDVKTTMVSYLSFLREVLTKEWLRKQELLSPFAKSVAYWFDMNILSSYFKDENSKMDKDDRTSLNSEMLSLHYWDSFSNFEGLQKQSRYQLDSSRSGDEIASEFVDRSLEDLFKTSYMPAQFNLFSISTWDSEDILEIVWLDQRTNFTLDAILRYADLQISVIRVDIYQDEILRQKLTERINALIGIEGAKYSLTQILQEIENNKDITDAESIGSIDSFCLQVENIFTSRLVSCSPEMVEISSMRQGLRESYEVVYTFYLENYALKYLEISDDVLETQILNEIDLESIDAPSSIHMMEMIVNFEPTTVEGFWFNTYRTVSDRITQYLWGISPEIESDWGEMKVTFIVGWITFVGTYDVVENIMKPIALDESNFRNMNRSIIVQWFSLEFTENGKEDINSFLSNPLEYLRRINVALVDKYFWD